MASYPDGTRIETDGCSEWSCPYHGAENRRKHTEAWTAEYNRLSAQTLEEFAKITGGTGA